MLEKNKFSLQTTVAALGVVYGDIGTSPLYALQVTLGDLSETQEDIFGILSLILWSLILSISIKYLSIIFRVDNNGEGGMLAVLALLKQKYNQNKHFFYLIAILGAGLLLGDGMLTPAISVISAVEGLSLISPVFNPYILFLSCIILFFVFIFQAKGTGRLGAIFGPIMLVWFFTIALLGLRQIIDNPVVLKAMNPAYGLEFLYINGWRGYVVLGGVFLVVTGGEALYADIGHFGKNPIRYSWFFIVFPSLILNYFGQGAYLLEHAGKAENPFFLIAPEWFVIPLIILAAMATVIASQAVISATFSLAKQAVLLGLCPRLQIIHTSSKYEGQIYVPQVNAILFIGTFFLLLTFKSSANLANAYGIAVNFYMLLMTSMIAYVAYTIWQWHAAKVILVLGGFLCMDLAFLGANSHKFLTGGWLPIFFAFLVAFMMHTWGLGLEYIRNHFYMKKAAISKILHQLDFKSLTHLKGLTAIFITDVYDKSGGSFLHFLKLSRSVPEHILLVSYMVENIPYVYPNDRFEVELLSKKVCRLTLHYGFMDHISIPTALDLAARKDIIPFPVNINTASYIVEVPNVIASKRKKSLPFHFQEKLFAFLMRNYSSNLNIEFYDLPYDRTIGIGSYFLL